MYKDNRCYCCDPVFSMDESINYSRSGFGQYEAGGGVADDLPHAHIRPPDSSSALLLELMGPLLLSKNITSLHACGSSVA